MVFGDEYGGIGGSVPDKDTRRRIYADGIDNIQENKWQQ